MDFEFRLICLKPETFVSGCLVVLPSPVWVSGEDIGACSACISACGAQWRVALSLFSLAAETSGHGKKTCSKLPQN